MLRFSFLFLSVVVLVFHGFVKSAYGPLTNKISWRCIYGESTDDYKEQEEEHFYTGRFPLEKVRLFVNDNCMVRLDIFHKNNITDEDLRKVNDVVIDEPIRKLIYRATS